MGGGLRESIKTEKNLDLEFFLSKKLFLIYFSEKKKLRYEGMWRDGRQEGEGMLKMSGFKERIGLWENGKIKVWVEEAINLKQIQNKLNNSRLTEKK